MPSSPPTGDRPRDIGIPLGRRARGVHLRGHAVNLDLEGDVTDRRDRLRLRDLLRGAALRRGRLAPSEGVDGRPRAMVAGEAAEQDADELCAHRRLEALPRRRPSRCRHALQPRAMVEEETATTLAAHFHFRRSCLDHRPGGRRSSIPDESERPTVDENRAAKGLIRGLGADDVLTAGIRAQENRITEKTS